MTLEAETCPSCGAKIVFARDQYGTWQVLNRTRARAYRYTGADRRVVFDELPGSARGHVLADLAYVTHYLSCSDPQYWTRELARRNQKDPNGCSDKQTK